MIKKKRNLSHIGILSAMPEEVGVILDNLKFVKKSSFGDIDLFSGEIVINTMNSDGTKLGFDIDQINQITSDLTIPCIASGGAGNMKHFADVFEKTQVTGALAASVFHKNIVNIKELKLFLSNQNICIRQ